MADHKSAQKRARQDLKRRARNRHVVSGMRTAVKRFHAALAGGNVEESQAALRTAESVIRRAATKGVIPRQRASRHISRLTRRANASTP